MEGGQRLVAAITSMEELLLSVVTLALREVLDDVFKDSDETLRDAAAQRLAAVAVMLTKRDGFEKLKQQPLVEAELMDFKNELRLYSSQDRGFCGEEVAKSHRLPLPPLVFP